ncbi:MAG: NADPH-dependent glutamate synthase [Dehalococcoidales bacterium]|jgi:glutamate synthase (NADPH/NADH) small chain|nr:NADPH-dependent glutamate synthase [Dehalococcoidales bacterium]MDP6737830.1 NADPH-dependent glutamate synthase [Dehalococcoidales bacterium]
MPKLNLNREEMPRQDPKARGKNFNEVALGYSIEQTMAEANRCLLCAKSPCASGCPVSVDIPDFIKALQENNLPEAVKVLKRKNSLPGICGRVCPQETQCEEVCVIAKRGAPVAIGRLERYVADWERMNKGVISVASNLPPPTGKRVAVVGSGPAGLTAAADLAKLGHSVTIFEALHTAGGVLTYGIPEFRLPNEIVQEEINYVTSLGVKLELDAVVGKLATIDELLKDDYHAVFLGTGAGLPMFLNLPGENLNSVYSANEFLTRVNLMKAYCFPAYDTPLKAGKKVAVIGGGNVAMDAARCALRLGAKEVYVVYRRSETELPARREEVENAMEEGVIFKFLTNPKQFLGNEQGTVVGIECIQMELGDPDESGRRRPIPKPASEFIIPVNTVIIALGTTPNPLIAQTTTGLSTNHHGTVIADETIGKTVKPKVWAGGDIVTGAATVISAMGAGKRAAADMDKFLRE